MPLLRYPLQRLARLFFVQRFYVDLKICVHHTYPIPFGLETVDQKAELFAPATSPAATMYDQYLAIGQCRKVGSQVLLEERLPVFRVVASLQRP